MVIKIVGLMVALMAPSMALAGAVKIPGSWKKGAASASLRRKMAPKNNVELESETPTTGTKVPSCNEDGYRGKEVSLTFLDEITQEILYDDRMSVDENGALTGNIYLNRYISACFEPVISTVKLEGENKLFVKIENIYFDNEAELPQEIKDIAKQNISIDDKYKKCLESKGFLKVENGEKVLDIEKIERERAISSVRLPYRDATSNDGSEPLTLDMRKDYQLYFASNKASYYNIPPEDQVDTVPGWGACMAYYQWSKEEPFFKGQLDSLHSDIVDICRSKGKSAGEQIKDLLVLRNSYSLSSFGILAGAVDDIIIKKLADDQEALLKEKDFEDIEDKMREYVSENIRNVNKGMVDKELTDNAKALGKKYRKLMDNLKSQIHNPARKMIEKLHKDLENARSEKQREHIKERLSRLSEVMGDFAEGRKNKSCERQRPCAFFKHFYIYGGKERFKKYASEYEGMRLSSHHWSKSSKSPSSVQRRIKTGQRRFDRKASSWGREAAVLEGSKAPIYSQQKRIQKNFEKAQKIYREGPYKNLGWWCRGANTQSCAKKRRRLEQNFRARMQRMGSVMQKDQSRLSRYEKLADQYQLRREWEREQDGWGEEEYDFFGGDEYSSGDDYHFPGFGGSRYQQQYQGGPYDPSMFNMGGLPPLGPGGPPPFQPMGPRW